METQITIDQVKELSPATRLILAEWFERQITHDDDLVDVFIPEEEAGQNGGHYSGFWDTESDFDFPEPYNGKLKNHRGTILPLLTIGQMIALLDDNDNDNLAFRLHLLLHVPNRPREKWSFDTGALAHTLWEGCKEVLEASNREE
jgi:hypothetical protein